MRQRLGFSQRNRKRLRPWCAHEQSTRACSIGEIACGRYTFRCQLCGAVATFDAGDSPLGLSDAEVRAMLPRCILKQSSLRGVFYTDGEGVVQCGAHPSFDDVRRIANDPFVRPVVEQIKVGALERERRYTVPTPRRRKADI